MHQRPRPFFRHSWRTYQARVLEHLPRYRADRRVHIVAPPGAGKTVLGLEILRRAAVPTLVLAPSLTIRSQWAERYVVDFGADPAGISHELGEPTDLTIVTYQALFEHHKRRGLEGLEWVRLLVVDECHHLRNAWWKVLTELRTTHDPELVALTATPPYDVSGREWRRYHEFCGEIDEAISVPELVASGDLCPHQDYLYPVLPAPAVADVVRNWQEKKRELLALFHERGRLAYHVLEHPWLTEPEAHYEDIFARPDYFTALLSVLAAQGSVPPATALGVLHGDTTLGPPLTDEWAAVFLAHALREDPHFRTPEGMEILRPFRRRVTDLHAWHDNKLRLADELPPGTQTEADLSSPAAQMEAIVDIVRTEYTSLGPNLHMVILTDYIRPEYLPTTEHDRRELGQMGTVPVFETLRRAEDLADELGERPALCVLTGSLVIIPAAAAGRLLRIAYDELPTERVITHQPLFENSRYVRLTLGTIPTKYTVRWITQLFSEGLLRVIVGTKSLLGEGWDAPVINSLVLASAVGSFVLTNQMRGRAIRTRPGFPGKTANIWHPVVLYPGTATGGPELEKLRRRSRVFAGPRLDGRPVIQNGLDRFGINWQQVTTDDLPDIRARTRVQARGRSALAGVWKNALTTGDHLVEAIHPPAERYFERRDPLTIHFRESIQRHFAADWRTVTADVKKFGVIALLVALGSLALISSTTLAYLLAGIALPFLLFVTIRFGRLWWRTLGKDFIHRANPRLASVEGIGEYVLALLLAGGIAWASHPVFFGVFALVFGGALSVRFLATVGKEERRATRFHELLSNPGERLRRYGAAVAETLRSQQLLHAEEPLDLTVERHRNDVVCYLRNATHHDDQLFATALTELLAPVDNPRYLLQLDTLEGWDEPAYYLPVPTELGRRQEHARAFAQRLSHELGLPLRPVFTREPAGRLRLLTARLQGVGRADARVVRDQLWR